MSADYRNIVIPIETTARELNPKLFLSMSLARQGFRCFMGHKAQALDTALTLGNAIYIDKGYHRGTSEETYRQLKQAGCLIASLDEENGVDFRDFHMLNNRMPDAFLTEMDLVLLWGTKQQAHLRDNRQHYDDSKVRITGHPRFDLLKEQYMALYQDKVTQLKQQFGDFILFNTNSKYSNNINGRESVIANYGSRVRGLDDRLAYDDKRLALNISLIRRMATELGKTVVVRPHPEESIQVYRDTFADLPNVHALYEDSALYWILAAEGVIHNHSTTGLEAATLGRNPLAYTPIPTEENFCPWIPIACSHRFETEDDAINFIARDGWGDKPAEMEEILRDFFSFHEAAMPKVVSALVELRDKSQFSGKSRSLMPKLVRWRATEAVYKMLGRQSQSRLSANKLKDLTPDRVEEYFRALQKVMPTADKPENLKPLTSLLYEISA